jgi:hypothetical protein
MHIRATHRRRQRTAKYLILHQSEISGRLPPRLHQVFDDRPSGHSDRQPALQRSASTQGTGTLARAGYDVTVLGAWLDRGFKNRDQKIIQSAPFDFVSVLDFTVSEAVRLFARARSKMALL